MSLPVLQYDFVLVTRVCIPVLCSRITILDVSVLQPNAHRYLLVGMHKFFVTGIIINNNNTNCNKNKNCIYFKFTIALAAFRNTDLITSYNCTIVVGTRVYVCICIHVNGTE